MATASSEHVNQVWDDPVWPEAIPDADRLRLVYGGMADELVVLFEAAQGREGYFDFVATPEVDYAAIKVDMASGEVIGVLVYPLVAWAVKKHPDWRSAMTRHAPTEIARRIVLDIKNLHARYGLAPETDR